jgi:hypothetical protein
MTLQDGSWLPKNQADKNAVLKQMERILVHPVFRNSIRSAKLFRYCIEQSLQDDSPQLKERTIGIEVFGRDAEYDTNQDSIVRAAASDVRKRIAQYYHEPGHEAELVIDLPAFAYAPEFHLPHGNLAEPEESNSQAALQVESVPGIFSTRRKLFVAVSIFLVAFFIVIAAVLIWRLEGIKPQRAATTDIPTTKRMVGTTLDSFWKPVLDRSAPILMCIGESQMDSRGIGTASVKADYGPRNAVAIAQLAKFLGRRDKMLRVKDADSTTNNDMGQGSSVLISGQSNFWTLRETDQLRFHFAGGPEASAVWIEDRDNPSQRQWSIALPGINATTDYAIAARILDVTTGNWVVIAAGLGESGTSAAAHCLIDTSCLNEILKNGPQDWASKNLEVVIETQVGSESPSAPRVMAVNFW